jgi:hypothetical protein
MKKYKYLNYIPPPVKLEPRFYDLVNDEEFCRPDGRIPLLMLTQHGVFPGKGCYPGKKGYYYLEGLDHKRVGFIRRGFLSDREYGDIIEYYLDLNTLKLIRNGGLTINSILWNKLNRDN